MNEMVNNEVFSLIKVGASDSSNLIMVDTKEAVLKFIYEQADRLNCGVYRVWYFEPFTYYDCGPVVYKVNANWFEDEISDSLKVEN